VIIEDLDEVSSLSTTSSAWLSKPTVVHNSTGEFVYALNSVTESEDVTKTRCLSLLLDESNNILCAKDLTVYCQFLDRENNKKELKFIKLLTLKECDAGSIFKLVAEYFHRIDNSMIMFISDGLSVILGCSNGVQAKLKSVIPHLMECHCVAHQKSLAVSQAYQSFEYLFK